MKSVHILYILKIGRVAAAGREYKERHWILKQAATLGFLTLCLSH
jgi:hypothetical protein